MAAIPIDVVTPANLGVVVQVIAGGQQAVSPPLSISEDVRQSVRRLLDSAVVAEGA